MFSVCLLYASLDVDDQTVKEDTLWEEIVYLVDAFTEDEAREKAELIGKKNEVSYQTVSGRQIVWKFQKITHLSSLEVSDISDGTEVFSRFLNSKQVEILDQNP